MRGSQGRTAAHAERMTFHMKTTLNIDDGVMKRFRVEAVRRGCSMSELVERALRMLLESERRPDHEGPGLSTYDMGPMLVDVADRDALYRVMEER